jgi:hypothetical protein
MKTISKVFFTVLLITSFSVQAEVASKQELLRFAKAIGIYEQIEEQKAAVDSQGLQAAQQYAQQIMASTPGLPEEFSKDLERELQIYMSNIGSIIDTDFAVKTYIELISKKLSSKEILQLTEFYESELGRKYTKSNTEIMGDWTNAFLADVDKKIMVQLQSFTKNLMASAASYQQQ